MTGSVVDRLRSAAVAVDRAGLRRFDPYPYQRPPREWGRVSDGVFLQWWLLGGGRDAGKTMGAARATVEHALGPPCFPGTDEPHRMLIVAPTLGDAREACVRGPSGLQYHYPRVETVGGENFTKVRFPNGSTAPLVSMATRREVERLRAVGSNRCFAWLEEAAAAPQLGEAMKQLDFCLRAGSATGVMSTTPRRRRSFLSFVDRPEVVRTRGSTTDNVARASTEIGAARHAALLARYEHTANGAQEIHGEVGGEVPGALWRQDWIDDARLLEVPNVPLVELGRVVAAFDPSKGARDSTGISVAVELDDCWCDLDVPRPHYGVAADETRRLALTPAMRHAGRVALDWRADCGVVETNGVGGRAAEILATLYPELRLVRVNASEGKALRAETVAMLYESLRVHHLGPVDRYAELETEMTTWVPPESVVDDEQDDPDDDDWSPDRLDAAVYGIRELAGIGAGDTGGWIL